MIIMIMIMIMMIMMTMIMTMIMIMMINMLLICYKYVIIITIIITIIIINIIAFYGLRTHNTLGGVQYSNRCIHYTVQKKEQNSLYFYAWMTASTGPLDNEAQYTMSEFL
jgi:hypothetical protein